MTEWLRSWVLGLCASALICALAMTLTPKGPVKGVVKAVCGVVLASALLSPLLRLDFGGYALQLARYREEAAAFTAGAEELRKRLDRTVIEQELEAYIWDKAAQYGVELSAVTVRARWSTEGVWLPETAELTGPYDDGLAGSIEAELGIPRGAQNWRVDEELESD